MYYQFVSHLDKTPRPNIDGAIFVECKALCHVVTSFAEAKTADVFFNVQTSLPIQTILNALNHPQLPTPIRTDKSSTNGFIHNNIHKKRSKS